MLRSLVKHAFGVAIVIATLTTSVQSVALDSELTESADFRVRVGAALRLTKAGSRADLEAGLKDSHPAVRIACAGGLKTIGDPAAIPALERAMRGESAANVKSTMEDAIAKLKAGGSVKSANPSTPTSLAGARYVVQLGAMKNVSGARGSDLDAIMRSAARTKAGGITGAVVIDGSDPSVLQRATAASIPVLQIDGNLTKLTNVTGTDGSTVVSAKVECSVRKLPNQTLKGTVSGNASGSAGSSHGTSAQGIRQLEDRVVGGAVESAVGSMGKELATLAK